MARISVKEVSLVKEILMLRHELNMAGVFVGNTTIRNSIADTLQSNKQFLIDKKYIKEDEQEGLDRKRKG